MEPIKAGDAFIVYRVGDGDTWTGPFWPHRKLARASVARARMCGLRPMCIVVVKEVRRG